VLGGEAVVRGDDDGVVFQCPVQDVLNPGEPVAEDEAAAVEEVDARPGRGLASRVNTDAARSPSGPGTVTTS
jgi:hypothetical protein